MKQLYKLCQASLLCLSLLFFAPGLLFSQKRTLTAYPNTVVDSFIHGFYTSLPASYSTSGTKKYPLLVFLHGMGEIGNGSASALPAVLRNGPPMQINQQVNNNTNANFPDPVTVNGQSFEFIVVAPQLNTWPWNGYEQLAVNDMINYAIRNYRVDTSKMYLTGLSMGGGIAWEYPGYSGPMYAKRLAGLLVVAGASSPSSERAAEIAKEHLPVWATANSVDGTAPTSYTTQYIQLLNAAGANPAPQMTIFPDQGHGGWIKTYGAPNQPGVVQNGLNVYQWMLQYKRQGDNVIMDKGTSIPPPTVNAGADQTITLPANSVTLTGAASDANGSITAYKWAQASGPNSASLSSNTKIGTAASGLVQGTYVFTFTATSSTGQSASDQVTVTVKPAATPTLTVDAGSDQTVTLPNRANLSGSATATNSTVTAYKWVQVSGPATSYFTNSAAAQTQVTGLVAGTYVFKLTATGSTGLTTSDQVTVTAKATSVEATLTVNAGPDQIIALPNRATLTGSATATNSSITSYKWVQVSGPATSYFLNSAAAQTQVTGLVAGTYVFKLTATGSTGLTASDQITITTRTAAAGAATASDKATALSLNDSTGGTTTVRVYPNPVPADQQLAVEGQGLKAGTLKFQIYDMSGKVVKQVVQTVQSGYFRQTIQVSGLAKGSYVLAVMMDGEKAKTFKLIIE